MSGATADPRDVTVRDFRARYATRRPHSLTAEPALRGRATSRACPPSC